MKYKDKKKIAKEIVERRIDILFSLASEQAHQHNFSLADKYVEHSRELGMKYNIRIPKKYKILFCKYCYRYLLPGYNANVRIKRKKVIIYCKRCQNYRRIPYIREKKIVRFRNI